MRAGVVTCLYEYDLQWETFLLFVAAWNGITDQ